MLRFFGKGKGAKEFLLDKRASYEEIANFYCGAFQGHQGQ